MNKLYDQVEELLDEHHENEIGRLLGVPDKDVKLTAREIRSHIKDWCPEQVCEDVWAIFSLCYSAEYIDADGENQGFDTKAEALEYIKQEKINESV